MSIKNKSSLSSWQESARQSAQMEQQADDNGLSRNFQAARHIHSLVDRRGSLGWDDEDDSAQVAASPLVDPC